MVSPDFVTQTKTKTNPASILHPFPPTLKERQQPAQAIKVPSLFTAPVPKDRLSSQLPTNLLPKNAPTPCESVVFIGLPSVFQAAFAQKSCSSALGFPPVRRWPAGDFGRFWSSPHLPDAGWVLSHSYIA